MTINEMRPPALVTTATVLGLTVALAVTRPTAHAGDQEPAPAPSSQPRAGGPGPGGGRGEANPAAALYAEHCAGFGVAQALRMHEQCGLFHPRAELIQFP